MKVLAGPSFIFPFLAGITDLVALWALSIPSGIGIFAGIAAIVAAVGIVLTRITIGHKALVKEALESVQQEALLAREQALDDLDKRLAADGDHRTESCLRDLRALAGAFEQGRAWAGSLNSSTGIDVLSGVDQLFKQCVVSLEKTLELWYTARRMVTSAARKPILKQRELLIADVTESIQKLGKVLADIQSLQVGSGRQHSELAEIRQELDQSLKVARRVKKRLKAFEEEIEKQ